MRLSQLLSISYPYRRKMMTIKMEMIKLNMKTRTQSVWRDLRKMKLKRFTRT